MKLTIEYVDRHSADAHAVSDYYVEKAYQNILQVYHNSMTYTHLHLSYSTFNMINRILVGIKEGDISHVDVLFLFNGAYIESDRYGNLDSRPKGFYCSCEDLIFRLIDGDMP